MECAYFGTFLALYYCEPIKTTSIMAKETTLKDRPINPRTGYPYKEGTKKFEEWWKNLNETDKRVYADLTANI